MLILPRMSSVVIAINEKTIANDYSIMFPRVLSGLNMLMMLAHIKSSEDRVNTALRNFNILLLTRLFCNVFLRPDCFPSIKFIIN